MKFITFVFIAFTMSSLALTKTLISGEEEKATCVLADLLICKSAVTTESPPSKECCAKLKEQQSCFCDYLKDPSAGQYITAAKKVLAACDIPFPSC
ncbi:PREDICTED: non-specific lipid-transfer protein 2P-like [Camelina sativa]|uniref:Non-specific lipid-transfer protein 2P-like n=2 Tax=Camelina sativa TaxID=90675 RepID=A0ABM1QRY6_CAMSA|nr:PREDICTED: non-specific lipid-transfer protein 2P-like [Camelina sativa]